MNYELEIAELKKRIESLEKIILTKNLESSQKSKQSNRDKTKYMFEGRIYPKNRLVLAIIKTYVKNNNPSYEELNNVFDKSLQGSLKVVELYENALNISDGSKRYFMKEDDILILNNQKVVVCTQWGIFNIVKFIKLAKSLNFDIQTI